MTGPAQPGHATTVPTDADRRFLRAAHQAHLGAVAAGHVAAERAHGEPVHRLGQHLVDEHLDLDTALVALARDLEVDLPGAPAPEQQTELASVVARSGAGLDAAWLALQVRAHRRDLALTEAELAEGSHADVRDLAMTTASRLREHLDLTVRTAEQLGVRATAAVQGHAGADHAEPDPGAVVRRVQLTSFLAGLAMGSALGALAAAATAGRRERAAG